MKTQWAKTLEKVWKKYSKNGESEEVSFPTTSNFLAGFDICCKLQTFSKPPTKENVWGLVLTFPTKFLEFGIKLLRFHRKKSLEFEIFYRDFFQTICRCFCPPGIYFRPLNEVNSTSVVWYVVYCNFRMLSKLPGIGFGLIIRCWLLSSGLWFIFIIEISELISIVLWYAQIYFTCF